jgi:hypothetical protein
MFRTRAIRSKRLFLWRLGLVAGGGFEPPPLGYEKNTIVFNNLQDAGGP